MSANYKVTLKCKLTGGDFDLWISDPAEAEEAARRLEATIVQIVPSSDKELVLAQVRVMLGLMPQLRLPGGGDD